MRIINLALLLVVPSVVSVATVPAVAETRSVRVSYSGLDLSSEAGRHTLERRIAHAARSLCGDPFGGSLGDKMAAKICANDAISGTRRQVTAATSRARGVDVATR